MTVRKRTDILKQKHATCSSKGHTVVRYNKAFGKWEPLTSNPEESLQKSTCIYAVYMGVNPKTFQNKPFIRATKGGLNVVSLPQDFEPYNQDLNLYTVYAGPKETENLQAFPIRKLQDDFKRVIISRVENKNPFEEPKINLREKALAAKNMQFIFESEIKDIDKLIRKYSK
jgi:hypothetical protein